MIDRMKEQNYIGVVMSVRSPGTMKIMFIFKGVVFKCYANKKFRLKNGVVY